MSRDSQSNRLLDGHPTPKFRSVARDIDEDVRTVMYSRMSSTHKVETLGDIIRSKNRVIDKLKHELADVHEMYEKVYEELQKLKYQQRSLNAMRNHQINERARSLEVKRTVEEHIFFENGDRELVNTRKRVDIHQASREEGSIGTVVHRKAKSKSSSIDSNSLNLSSIKPNPIGQFESSYKQREMSPNFAKAHLDEFRVQNLRPLMSFLTRRYPDVTDDSQYLPHIRYEFEQLDKNSNFFGVLYRAALELTPEKDAGNLSAEPKELWRWLKWFFKQYMQLREQISENHRFSVKLSIPQGKEQVLSKEFEEIIILLEASSVESARENLLAFKKDALICRQLSFKVASIFGLNQNNPVEVLQSLDRIHFTLEKERELGVEAN